MISLVPHGLYEVGIKYTRTEITRYRFMDSHLRQRTSLKALRCREIENFTMASENTPHVQAKFFTKQSQ